MTTRAQGGRNDAVSLEKLTDAIDETADKGRDILNQGREAVSEFSDGAQKYVARNAEVAYRGTRDAAEVAGKGAAQFIRERPLSALALAVGAGIIGTLLLSRGRH